MAIDKLIIGSTRQTRLKAGVDDNNFVRVQDLNSVIEQINNEVVAASPSSFTGTLTQTGTNDPVITELFNGLGSTVTASRNGSGDYTVRIQPDVVGTIVAFVGSISDGGDFAANCLAAVEVVDNGTLTIFTNDATNASLDDALLDTPLKIEVYP